MYAFLAALPLVRSFGRTPTSKTETVGEVVHWTPASRKQRSSAQLLHFVATCIDDLRPTTKGPSTPSTTQHNNTTSLTKGSSTPSTSTTHRRLKDHLHCQRLNTTTQHHSLKYRLQRQSTTRTHLRRLNFICNHRDIESPSKTQSILSSTRTVQFCHLLVVLLLVVVD